MIDAPRDGDPELPELHVVAAGSLLDLALHQIPTGVGRVSYLDVYPLGFPEYLEAAGQSPLRELIRDTAEPLAQPPYAVERLEKQHPA